MILYDIVCSPGLGESPPLPEWEPLDRANAIQSSPGTSRQVVNHLYDWYNPDAVLILDNLVIPDYVQRIMGLGHGFNHFLTDPKSIRKYRIEELVCVANIDSGPLDINVSQKREFDAGIKELVKDVISKDRSFFHGANLERSLQISEDLKLTIKFLKDNPDVVISRADKGGKSIASSRETIVRLREQHIAENIDNGTYNVVHRRLNWLSEVMDGEWKSLLAQIVSDITSAEMGGTGLSVGSDRDLFQLLHCRMGAQDKVFTPGRMWGQIKVHKPVLAYRPIVDNSIKLGQPLEKLVLATLNDILASKSRFSVKNSLEVVKILNSKFTSELIISAEHRLLSADFTSMYTNVPTVKALALVKDLWDAHVGSEVNNLSRSKGGQIPCFSGAMARDIVEFFVCKGGIFSAGDTLYRQKKGLMMGSSLSSVIAALLIEDALSRIVGGIGKNSVLMVYADDILFIGDPIDFGRILQTLELHLGEMPFTVEKEDMCSSDHSRFSIRYLEIMLERRILFQGRSKRPTGARLSYLWSHRVYDAGVTMHYLSLHSEQTKLGLVRNLLSKAICLSSSDNMVLAIEKWFAHLTKNCYPVWLLLKIAEESIHSGVYTRKQRNAAAAALWAYRNKNGIAAVGRGARRKRKACGAPAPGENRKTYVSFPMGCGLGNTQKLYRDLVPGASLAPHTYAKNSELIFTKIKDPLHHMHTFGVVVTWKCAVPSCTSAFIALARDFSLHHSISNLTKYKPGPFFKHMDEKHGLIPSYPERIKILSGKAEKGVAALNNRLAIEMAANPLLICASGCYTNSVRMDIINAVVEVSGLSGESSNC